MKNLIDIFARNVPGMTDALSNVRIGIAGLGGLGSNIAISLIRAGAINLVLTDFDTVETSNLNRQHYFISDIGKPKTQALRDHIFNINPIANPVLYNIKVTKENVSMLFGSCDILIEAFDRAETKKMLIDSWCKFYPYKPIIVGNGISNIGNPEDINVENIGNVWFIGDGETDMSEGLCSAKIASVANIQAHVAIKIACEIYGSMKGNV